MPLLCALSEIDKGLWCVVLRMCPVLPCSVWRQLSPDSGFMAIMLQSHSIFICLSPGLYNACSWQVQYMLFTYHVGAKAVLWLTECPVCVVSSVVLVSPMVLSSSIVMCWLLYLCNAVIRTVLKGIAGKVTRSSLNIAKLAVFWAGVFIAARFILESNWGYTHAACLWGP